MTWRVAVSPVQLILGAFMAGRLFTTMLNACAEECTTIMIGKLDGVLLIAACVMLAACSFQGERHP